MLSASKNPQIPNDIAGTVTTGVIEIALPYSVAQSTFTPTVGLPSSDFTITPNGSYEFEDGMALTVSRTSTGQTWTYTVAVAITEATLPPAPPDPIVTGFTISASNNPSLSSDVSGIMSGTTISVVLPYSASSIPLTPIVTFSGSQYSISPSGAFVMQNGMTLTVSDSSTNELYSYTLDVSIAPNTLPAQSLIASYVLEPGNNPSILKTIDAIVSGSVVSIVIPYSASLVALTPTVTMVSSDYSISPSGSYVLQNGMNLYAVNTQTNQTYTYTLEVSIDPSTLPPESVISSYVLKASDNSALSNDIDAIISGTTVSVVLPYSVIQNSTPLAPTVSFITNDYTISPGGTYVLTNGETLTVTQISTGETYTYTLKVSVDPSTVLRSGPAALYAVRTTRSGEYRREGGMT